MSMASTQLFHGSHVLRDLVGELKTETTVTPPPPEELAVESPHPRLTPPKPQPPLAKKVA
jgi:hypothetical protein